MRKLVYVLQNGTTVNTLAEAKNAGMAYEAKMVNTNGEFSEVSPIRKAMLDKFGYVSKDLRDKV